MYTIEIYVEGFLTAFIECKCKRSKAYRLARLLNDGAAIDTYYKARML